MVSGEEREVEHGLAVATRAAAAGARQLRRRPTRQEHKGGDLINVVTDRDLASQRAIFRILGAAFPEHTLVGEEGGYTGMMPPGPVWTVDPLDGTSNFAHGQAPYGVSIGFARDGRSLVGVVALPTASALAWAVRGRGAFLRRLGRTRQLRVAETATLSHAMVLSGYGYGREGYPAWLARLARVIGQAQAVRMSGAAVADFVSVATGAAQVYWEDELQPWDWAAGALIVEEAGGRVTRPDGGPLIYGAGPCVATNGYLHEEMLGLIR